MQSSLNNARYSAFYSSYRLKSEIPNDVPDLRSKISEHIQVSDCCKPLHVACFHLIRHVLRHLNKYPFAFLVCLRFQISVNQFLADPDFPKLAAFRVEPLAKPLQQVSVHPVNYPLRLVVASQSCKMTASFRRQFFHDIRSLYSLAGGTEKPCVVHEQIKILPCGNVAVPGIVEKRSAHSNHLSTCFTAFYIISPFSDGF